MLQFFQRRNRFIVPVCNNLFARHSSLKFVFVWGSAQPFDITIAFKWNVSVCFRHCELAYRRLSAEVESKQKGAHNYNFSNVSRHESIVVVITSTAD